MSWFFVALIAPLLWSLVNHCDKFILSRYFKGGGSGGLMIFSGVVGLPLAVALFIFFPEVLSVSITDALILIGTGLLYNIGVYLYLLALEHEDASYIVPFWQLVPVFSYFIGIFVLGEYISSSKILSGIVVLVGALILSIEFDRGYFRINRRTVKIMVASSLALALSYTLFKKSTIDDSSFILSMFWNQFGFFLFGALCFMVPKYRGEFLNVIDQNSSGVLGLNIVEQAVETIGVMASNFSVLLAPAALVILVEYTAQPFFVFAEGIILTILFPQFVKEDISHGNLAQKFVSIIIMAIGLYMINI